MVSKKVSGEKKQQTSALISSSLLFLTVKILLLLSVREHLWLNTLDALYIFVQMLAFYRKSEFWKKYE